MLLSTRSLPRIALVVFLGIFVLQWAYFGQAIPRRKSEDWKNVSWSKTHETPETSKGQESTNIAPEHKASSGDHESQPESKIEPPSKPSPSPSKDANKSVDSLLPCAKAEGMDDIVYVIKTGANEVDEKLPVHFNTTMKCWPHVLIFGDFSEEYEGHTVHDALRNIDPKIRLEADSFELWRRIHEKGRGDLKPEELSTHNKAENPNAGGGQVNNKGWAMDKFKFLPMLGESLELKPNAKWFLFTDSDTYVSWSNMATWLKMLDPKKTSYLGSPAMIGDQVFGHGGSGFLLSRPAVEAAAKAYAANQTYWDKYTSDHWAGDCVLANELEQELDLRIISAFPMLQGGDPTVMDWSEIGYDRKLWCFPAMSYHHLSPPLLEEMFEFEHDWVASDMGKKNKPLRHGDVFQQWLLPQLDKKDWPKWDNKAQDVLEEVPINDMHGCREICHGNSTCIQYTFGNGTCRTFDKVRLGGAIDNQSFSSGWMIKKINKFVTDFDKCDFKDQNEGKWVTN